MDKREKTNKERDTKDKDVEDFNAVLQMLDVSHRKLTASIDELLESRWMWGKTKTNLAIERGLLEKITLNAKQIVTNAFCIVSVYRRLDNLEKRIDEIAKKTDTDLSKIKAEMKELTLPKPVQRYIEEFRKEYEEWKQVQKRHFPQ